MQPNEVEPEITTKTIFVARTHNHIIHSIPTQRNYTQRDALIECNCSQLSYVRDTMQATDFYHVLKHD